MIASAPAALQHGAFGCPLVSCRSMRELQGRSRVAFYRAMLHELGSGPSRLDNPEPCLAPQTGAIRTPPNPQLRALSAQRGGSMHTRHPACGTGRCRLAAMPARSCFC